VSTTGHPINDLAIGLITAPRAPTLITETLASIRGAGFDQNISIFAEPGSTFPNDKDLQIHENRDRLGNVRNWLAAASRMRAKEWDFLLMCEDDFTLCRSSKHCLYQLIETKGGDADFGLASLYTPTRNIKKVNLDEQAGWVPLPVGSAGWGAQALCFSRRSFTSYMGSAEVGLLDPEAEFIDISVYSCFKRLGLATYFHLPSLARHDGRNCSTIGHPNFIEFNAVDFDPDF